MEKANQQTVSRHTSGNQTGLTIVDTAPDIARLRDRVVAQIALIFEARERICRIADELFGVEERERPQRISRPSAGAQITDFDGVCDDLGDEVAYLDQQLHRLGRLV